MHPKEKEHFFSLTPDRILESVEHALGKRATGRTLALNSMENRVYEIELEEAGPNEPESKVVAKFYRPGRWTRETILEEHQFIDELVEAEVPAIAPLRLKNGSTLGSLNESISFAVFPKVRGRIVQELSETQLEQAGRLLARMHNIGSAREARHRQQLSTRTHGLEPLEFLEASGCLPMQFRSRYRQLVETIARVSEPLLARAKKHRIHGDCHLGNVLWQNSGPFFLDFDDMLTGPAVQDIWLIVRGRDEEAQSSRETLLRGYETMREFDRSTLALIEPLRALRMVHYAAWIARRWDDPSFKNAFPDFGNEKYWTEEIQTLDEQLSLIS